MYVIVSLKVFQTTVKGNALNEDPRDMRTSTDTLIDQHSLHLSFFLSASLQKLLALQLKVSKCSCGGGIVQSSAISESYCRFHTRLCCGCLYTSNNRADGILKVSTSKVEKSDDCFNERNAGNHMTRLKALTFNITLQD